MRGPADPTALLPELKRVVAQADPDLPLAGVSTMEAVVSRSIAAPRFQGLLRAPRSSAPHWARSAAI